MPRLVDLDSGVFILLYKRAQGLLGEFVSFNFFVLTFSLLLAFQIDNLASSIYNSFGECELYQR